MYDASQPYAFSPEQAQEGQPGVWRYRHSFGLPEEAPVVSLGEGNTPLVWDEAWGREVAFKLEYLNPTGSFKDRGSALLLAFLKARGVEQAIEDSSGNAGASFAAYAARAGIQAQVFIPAGASGPKRAQIEAFGAQLVSVPGPRSQAAEAVRRLAGEGAVYASHAYLPFNLAGYATLAYEVVAQLGASPGTVVLPVGQGGLLLGAYRGFLALQQAGVISGIPRMVGVQAQACAPLWAHAAWGMAGWPRVSEGETVAEGIRVRDPVRGDAVLQAVQASGGALLAVPEEEILPGRAALARRGFFVEPTSAIIWPALGQLSADFPPPLVAILTGSGFKYDPG